MNKDIKLGVSFDYFKPGDVGAENEGMVVYYNEGLTTPDKLQQSVAFAVKIEKPDELMHFLNFYISPCIEEIISKILEHRGVK